MGSVLTNPQLQQVNRIINMASGLFCSGSIGLGVLQFRFWHDWGLGLGFRV